MKLGLLTEKGSSYSTQRIIECAKERGHEVQLINPLHCYMDISTHRPKVYTQNREELSDFDAILPRLGASSSQYGITVLRQFEIMETYTVNKSTAVTRSRDKLHTLQLLARKGIGLPVTTFANTPDATEHVLEIVGGAPVIIKLVEGTQGLGVVLAETSKAAESVIQAFQGLNANILVQEFIKESSGQDIRCFVIGDKVVASMLRTSAEGEFRSNVHRGGSVKKVKITPEERSSAVRASKAMGLTVAGVDILRSNHGPVIMEVNSSPGLEGIEKATQKNIAEKIVDYIEKNVNSAK